MQKDTIKLDTAIIQSIRNMTAGAMYAYSEAIKQTTGIYPDWDQLVSRYKLNDLDQQAAVKELRRLDLLPHLHNKGL